jgi:fermentation-respiration switch protein FrsA (DUF1100 family)
VKEMNKIYYTLIFVLAVYLVITLSLYFFQRNLLYYPSENNYSGDRLTVPIEKVKIKTQDNIELLSWYHKKNVSDYKTILFLHGNAGSLENRIHKINHFKDMNVNFLLLAWRGFSGNNGYPTEKGIYEDARSAVRWLKNKGIVEENIIIYGESLGTGVAIEVGQNRNFAGIILEAPFTSMIDIGKKHYPFFPVKLLLKDKYVSKNKIKNIKSPVLVMHGKEDKIVPFYMGKKIYDLANQPKFKYFPDDDDHMMNFDKNLINEIHLFLKNLN